MRRRQSDEHGKRSPSVVSTPVAFPSSTWILRGVVSKTDFPTALYHCRNECSRQARRIRQYTSGLCDGSPAMRECGVQSHDARRSTSRSPLKNRRPACTTGCSNSFWTNSRGDNLLTSSRRRPAEVRSKRLGALLARDGRRLTFRRKDIVQHSHELVAPSPHLLPRLSC